MLLIMTLELSKTYSWSGINICQRGNESGQAKLPFNKHLGIVEFLKQSINKKGNGAFSDQQIVSGIQEFFKRAPHRLAVEQLKSSSK